MNKITNAWSQKQTSGKVLSVLGIICSISIIILVCMQILGIWKTAINVFEPLLGLLILIQAIQNWKENKVIAIFKLCFVIFIFLVAIFILVIR
ncbi:hypothetical protein [Clostridium sp. C8-1-8]|uniref:hypothetical protein n=1 Tax=Clostridium sp. C8-1-8 TaxID=2698831 RepID=UPI00136EC4AE|nr:hypothetical protein [Clostridium sp. C8-1-8]